MKYHLPFGSMWKMKIEHPYSLLVQDGGYAWTCGQCPLDETGRVAHENDLIAQTHHVVQSIRTILDNSKLQSPAVAKLVVYYVEQQPDRVQEMIALLEQEFGESTLILPIAVPYFYYSGMLIEVDIHVAEANRFSHSVMIEKGGLNVQVADFDQLVWVKLSTAAGERQDERERAETLLDVLNDFELGPEELLADHWFVQPDAAAGVLDAFAARGLVTDLGAAATALLPTAVAAVGELTFVKRSCAQNRSVSTRRRIGYSTLTLRQRGDFFWAGVRIDKGGMSLPEQTRKAMIVLNNALIAHGLSFEQVCKVTTHYVGDSSPADLHDNMIVRNAYYNPPGPASTGLPVDSLLAADSLVTIDILGRHAS